MKKRNSRKVLQNLLDKLPSNSYLGYNRSTKKWGIWPDRMRWAAGMNPEVSFLFKEMEDFLSIVTEKFLLEETERG